MKTLGYYSFKTGRTYKTIGARKGAETKFETKQFNSKLTNLKQKYENTFKRASY